MMELTDLHPRLGGAILQTTALRLAEKRAGARPCLARAARGPADLAAIDRLWLDTIEGRLER